MHREAGDGRVQDEGDGASEKKAAVEAAVGTLKGDCSTLGDLKISSLVVTASGAGWYESGVGEVMKGNCELKKK